MDEEFRCGNCRLLLAESATPGVIIRCRRCGAKNMRTAIIHDDFELDEKALEKAHHRRRGGPSPPTEEPK